MGSEIVGREAELASLRAFVDEADGGHSAVALEGEAGIGKSTLWLAAIEYARAQGWTVLVSRPDEAERGLGYAGLGDLLEDAVDDVLPELLAPRRRALQVALLREEASGDRVDRRTLAVAVLDALQRISERAPTLIAVDDVPWLDPSSARALAFALRRLEASPVELLLARRLGEGAPESELERGLGTERIRKLVVGPLSAGALHRLLRDRLQRPFARQTLLRIHERSGGNPFFALELARILPEEVDHPLEPLPVPETLEELVRTRISALPPSTRKALALASALGTTSESLLKRAGIDAETLDASVAAGIIERGDGTIRFAHPLLSSVLYGDLGEERRHVHARIAQIVDDPVLRARHLAFSADAPDADVAQLLDDAAVLAADRGAAALTAELAEQALRLTPPELTDERLRRALASARAHLAAGEWTRARSIARDLLAETEEHPLRAEVLLLLAEFEHDDLAVPVLSEALRHAAAHSPLQALIHIRLGWAERFRQGFAAALEHTRRALEFADSVGDDALRFQALMNLNRLGRLVGDSEAPKYATRARNLAAAAGDARLLGEANLLLHGTFVDTGNIAARRAILESEHRAWRERDELFAADVLWELSWVEFWGERWALAAEYAARSRELRLQYGVERNQDYIPSSWIAVHRGELELARDESERALKLCEMQIGFYPPLLQAVPGLVALWSGDAATAAVHLGAADRQAHRLGWGSPEARAWTADYVEALLELDQVDEAIRLIDRWEADAQRLTQKRVLAHTRRCRGLVAAALGRIDEAVSVLEQTVDRHASVGDALGRSRALLALGLTRRRARQKRSAREAIRAALDGFEQLGAAGWAERARTELPRIGGRTRAQGLTATEERVARLAAEGLSNKQIAARLYVSVYTVEKHLSHVYEKLGIRSRGELAGRLGASA